MQYASIILNQLSRIEIRRVDGVILPPRRCHKRRIEMRIKWGHIDSEAVPLSLIIGIDEFAQGPTIIGTIARRVVAHKDVQIRRGV